ncbi:MAG: hypothetical protein Q7J07_01880 [Pelolinea sp.]|nr:hypothetical protein [Pelolinea sp.]
MTNRPLSVSAALIFILLNALVWLVLGVIIAADAHPALPDVPLIKGTMAFLALATAGILVGLFIFLGKHSRIAYFITLGLFAATSLLSIFDQFGLADLVILAINIIPIILLIKDRAWYLQVRPRAVKSN